MRNYEITTVYRTTAIEEAKNSFKEALAKHSVQIIQEEDWGTKKLWHPVDGQEYGYFHYIKCNAEPATIAKIENEAKINQDILKHMVVRIDG